MTFAWLPKPLRDGVFGGSGFSPRQTGKLAGWLRLAASTQSSGEWTQINDVVSVNPVVQTDADRMTAVGAAANGLPTMVFDGTDIHLWPLNATINNMTTKLGFWLTFKPAAVAGVQTLIYGEIAAGGPATVNKMSIITNGDDILIDTYITNVNGRRATLANVLVAGTWASIYVQYDSSRGGDANVALYLDGVSQSLAFSNIGAGGTLGALQAPTGNLFIGGASNSDTPTSPVTVGGLLGPNLFTFNDNLTAGEIAAVLAFERPT